MKVVQNISRILPNISLAKPRKRRLIACAVQAILLYDVPNWADKMSEKGKTELIKVQRKIAIIVVSAYSTISTEAFHPRDLFRNVNNLLNICFEISFEFSFTIIFVE